MQSMKETLYSRDGAVGLRLWCNPLFQMHSKNNSYNTTK